jgi:hypothetical protein
MMWIHGELGSLAVPTDDLVLDSVAADLLFVAGGGKLR